MMTEISRDQQLQEILVAYLEEAETGRTPDREAWLARHAEFTDELKEFLSGREKIEQVAELLKATADAPDSAQEAPTLGPEKAVPAHVGTKIRYFGDYELIEEIGRGGMGVVYKAKQASLKRTVALKMILTGQLANDDDVKRFHAEAEAAAKLDHPGIVPVYEVGRHEGHHYFAMAYVEGESLARKVAADPLEPRRAAELTKKIAEAVSYAHIEGVIHRDLKPANILIDKTGEPRLTDFGLAKRVTSDNRSLSPQPSPHAPDLTASGQVLGTPSYMPPEQASGQRGAVGPVSDVYSLGAILYCLVTGRPPFQAATPLDTLLQVLDREPVPPRQLNSSIPRDLETICLKCLQKEPAKRYPSARDLAADLDRFLTGKPVYARRIGPVARAWRWCRRKPALAAACAVSVLALVLTVVLSISFALYQSSAADRNRRLADRNQRLLAETYLDKGQELCEEGDRSRGLLWIARALEATPASAKDLEQLIRANLGAWVRPTPRLRRVIKHDESVEVVAFSRDGKIMLTGENKVNTWKGTARLWDTATGKQIGAPIPYRKGREISLSPDGKMVATGFSSDNKFDAQLWDTATGKLIRNIPFPQDRWVGTSECVVAFSGDGKILLTPNAQLVDVGTGTLLGRISSSQTIKCADMTPDGRFVVVGVVYFENGMQHAAQVYELTTGKTVGPALPWEAPEWYGPSTVAISADGKTVALGGKNGIPRLFDVTTGKPKGPTFAPGQALKLAPVASISFSSDGLTLITGHGTSYHDSSAQLWDVATGELISLPLSHTYVVVNVAVSRDGQRLLTAGSWDKSARLWDMPKRQPTALAFSAIADLAFSPDGKLIGTGGGEKKKGVARLLDRATGKPVADEIVPGLGKVNKVAFSHSGKIYVTASDFLDEKRHGWVVHRWDVGTGKPVGSALECDAVPIKEGNVTTFWAVSAIDISPDGKTLTTTERNAGKEARVRQWNLETGKFIAELHPGVSTSYWLSRIVVSPDGKRKLKTMEPDYTASITGPSPSESGQVQYQGAVFAAAFSPDGKCFLTGSWDKTARLWDSATLKPIGPSIKHGLPVGLVGFSPDGNAFWTGSESGARVQSMPLPVEGKAEWIVLWMQVLTGAELRGVQYHVLSGDEWMKRKERLEKSGGLPLP